MTVALVVALSGCGGSSDTSGQDSVGNRAAKVSGDADPTDVKVIEGWVDTLRRGDVEGAASYFAIPSVAQNGPELIRIRSTKDAVLFNRTLPCGARLVEAESTGKFTTATFRLTERPGPGACGPGVGTTAQTAFVIENGKIAEWSRVAVGGPRAPSNSV